MNTTRVSVVAGLALLLAVSCSAPPKPAQTQAEPAATQVEEPAATALVTTTRAMYVNVEVANVRKEPSRIAEVVGRARMGEEIVAVGEPELEWQKVVYGEAGSEAWIHATLLSPSLGDAEQTRMDAEASATAAAGATTGEADASTSAAETAAGETAMPVTSAPVTPDALVRVGTPADTVLSIRGAAVSEQIIGSDANGSIVEWKYSDVTYIMKRWMENGVECYRVAEIR